MGIILPFGNRSGVAHFTCTECGVEVHSFGDTERDNCVCLTCQRLGEMVNLPPDKLAQLRKILGYEEDE